MKPHWHALDSERSAVTLLRNRKSTDLEEEINIILMIVCYMCNQGQQLVSLAYLSLA